MEGKALLKEALQAEVGLPVDRNIPLIGFIGRLEEQKGSDILAAAIPKFMDENVQIIVLVSVRIRVHFSSHLSLCSHYWWDCPNKLMLMIEHSFPSRELEKGLWRGKLSN